MDRHASNGLNPDEIRVPHPVEAPTPELGRVAILTIRKHQNSWVGYVWASLIRSVNDPCPGHYPERDVVSVESLEGNFVNITEQKWRKSMRKRLNNLSIVSDKGTLRQTGPLLARLDAVP